MSDSDGQCQIKKICSLRDSMIVLTDICRLFLHFSLWAPSPYKMCCLWPCVIFFLPLVNGNTHISVLDWRKNVISDGPISKWNPPDSIKQKRQRGSLNNLAWLQILSATHEESESKSQIIRFASSALLLWQIKEVWKPYFSVQRLLSLLLANRLTNWLVLIAAKALQRPAFPVVFYKDLQEKVRTYSGQTKRFHVALRAKKRIRAKMSWTVAQNDKSENGV